MKVSLADDLARTTADADRRLRRLLADIDRHIEGTGLAYEVLAPEPQAELPLRSAPTSLNLRADGIQTVIWATGHRRAYPWLEVPVLDERGEIIQRRGVTPWPGLYVLGQRFQHFRSSNFIGGVGRDAEYVAAHIAGRSVPAACDRTSAHSPRSEREDLA